MARFGYRINRELTPFAWLKVYLIGEGREGREKRGERKGKDRRAEAKNHT